MPDVQIPDEFIDADAQGELVVGAWWPGDRFLFRGAWHDVRRIQVDVRNGRNTGLRYVTTGTPQPGIEPYSLVGLDGEAFEYQPCLSYLFDALLAFPTEMSDEHASHMADQMAAGAFG